MSMNILELLCINNKPQILSIMLSLNLKITIFWERFYQINYSKLRNQLLRLKIEYTIYLGAVYGVSHTI